MTRIDGLRPGMVLARPIHRSDGRIWLHEGVVLTESYIRRLREMGYSGAYISHGDPAPSREIPQPISEETRRSAAHQLQQVFATVQEGGQVDIDAVGWVASEIVDETLRNRHVLLSLVDIRTYDGYTFFHSVNVCVLSVLMAQALDYDRKQLKELAVGALLHDIGKVKLPVDVIRQARRLTAEEYSIIQQHPGHGFATLRRTPDISLLSAHVAYQHHERLQGQGYPRRLQGEDIHPYGRVAAVADVYDAMTAERTYRPPHPPSQALQWLEERAGSHFDPKAVQQLQRHVAPYPIGSRVQLNTGEWGVVVAVQRHAPDRPVVRLLFDARGRRIRQFAEVDLAQDADRWVQRALPP